MVQRPENPTNRPTVSFDEDGLQGIFNMISSKNSQTQEFEAHPGQLMMAREVIMHAVENNPDLLQEYGGKSLTRMDVYQLVPKAGLNLSAEGLTEYKEKVIKLRELEPEVRAKIKADRYSFTIESQIFPHGRKVQAEGVERVVALVLNPRFQQAVKNLEAKVDFLSSLPEPVTMERAGQILPELDKMSELSVSLGAWAADEQHAAMQLVEWLMRTRKI